MTIERAACHVTCNMCIMQVLYSEHVHTYFLLGVIHVSTVATVESHLSEHVGTEGVQLSEMFG